MAPEIGAALLDRRDILGPEFGLGDAAIHLHRPHRGHQHHAIGRKPRLAALDVHEFLGPQIGAEAGLRHHVIAQLERGGGGDDRVAAMRDIGERAAMHEGGVVLQRLHEVGLHRVLQQHGHRALGLDIAAIDRGLVAAIGDDHRAEARFEVLEIAGEAQDRHDLRGHGDVEPVFAGEAVGDPAQRRGDLPQRAVVHVHHAAPDHAARVDVEIVAPVDVVVDHRRQQAVRAGDGVEISGEMEVHVFHRHDLRAPAPGSAALHPEIRTQRGLADAHGGPFADAVEPVTETHGGGGLALARGGGVDRGHEDELAGRLALHRIDEILAHLGLVMAIGQQVIAGDAQFFTDLLNRPLPRLARDLDVGFVAHVRSLSWAGVSVPAIAALPRAERGESDTSSLTCGGRVAAARFRPARVRVPPGRLIGDMQAQDIAEARSGLRARPMPSPRAAPRLPP